MSDERKPEDMLREAYRILAGDLALIPTKEHLEVIAAEAMGKKQSLGALAMVLAAVLVDKGQNGMTIPADVLAAIRDRNLSVALQALANGDVVIALMANQQPRKVTVN